MKKIIRTSFYFGILFSIMYSGSSAIICRFVLACSIDWKSYIIGSAVIVSFVVLITLLISAAIRYLYNITKV